LISSLDCLKEKKNNNNPLIVWECYLVRNINVRKRRIYKIRKFDQLKFV
jgi:hypothetical protein